MYVSGHMNTPYMKTLKALKTAYRPKFASLLVFLVLRCFALGVQKRQKFVIRIVGLSENNTTCTVSISANFDSPKFQINHELYENSESVRYR